MTSVLYLEIWNQFALVRVYSTQTIYRVAQKVSHYHESSLNRTEPAIKTRFFINFD